MFAVTYLGQQGWSVASARSHVLVDPLLTEEYSPGFSAVVYPRRRFELAKVPAVDAVILSHEHADHLNVPSLALLDRRIPVVLPARAAAAMREVVAGLGFRVVPAHPGSAFVFGDLELHCFGGEPARDAELEAEGTTLQLLLRDRGGDGSFFTYVDSWPTEATIAALRRRLGRVGVFCHVNNAMDWSVLEAGLAPGWPAGSLDYAAEVIGAEAQWWAEGQPPALTVIAGPGLRFVGADAWMNQILSCDSQRICDALHALAPERAFASPSPGARFVFRDGELQRPTRRAAFVRPISSPRLRSVPCRPLLEEYPPACGRAELERDAWQALEHELESLAAYLYRRSLVSALHAQDRGAPAAAPRGFALVLRHTEELAVVLEYQVDRGRFAPVSCRAPMQTYAAGLECWASDLCAVLLGTQLPQRLLGHLRTWSLLPQARSVLQALWGFFDAANRQEAAAAFYRPLVQAYRDQPAKIRRGPGTRLRLGRSFALD